MHRTVPAPSAFPPLLPTPPGPKRPFTIRKLTSAEMLARREKGLCYNCDEKFFMGHKCQGKFFFLISDEGEDVADIHIEGVSTLPLPTEITTEAPEISLHAMAGLLSPRTLRLNAIILGLQVQTLIDGGSTHNFIQERIAKFLKLPILTSPHFSVMIDNGESMACKGYCPETVIQLGIETFVVNFYVISLQGAEVVLGVHWLQNLGTILMDYNKLYMEFMYKGKRVKLQGQPLIQVEEV